MRHLTGLDLSDGMLKKAKETACYEKLIQSDAVNYLATSCKKYDLITAVEVLGYLPEISELFRQVSTHLKKKGIFAFSVETTTSSKPELAFHGRYVYPLSHIIKCLKNHGLSVISQKETPLRLEGQTMAPGLIIIAHLSS